MTCLQERLSSCDDTNICLDLLLVENLKLLPRDHVDLQNRHSGQRLNFVNTQWEILISILNQFIYQYQLSPLFPEGLSLDMIRNNFFPISYVM